MHSGLFFYVDMSHAELESPVDEIEERMLFTSQLGEKLG
jgi:hypothetical protein